MTGTRLRADARRNQAEVLGAARHLFVERGIDCPLDEIAKRAGVGIGTLYRRFGDRDALVRAVLRDALATSLASAEAAVRAAEDADGDGLDALGRYLRDMVDARVSAVIPLALDRLDDPETEQARQASAAAVQALVDAAHADGSLPASVSFGDLGTLLVRLSRPLAGGVRAALDNRLAHRHLALVLAGLRSGVTLDEAGPERADLQGPVGPDD